jgi:hypothetical protein
MSKSVGVERHGSGGGDWPPTIESEDGNEIPFDGLCE